MYCYHCTGLHEPECKACLMCVRKTNNPNNESANLNQTLNHDIGLFVGKHSFFYIRNSSKYRHWNWSAFIFGGYWLLYRGMYAYLFTYISLLLVSLYTVYFYVWTSIDLTYMTVKLILTHSIFRIILALFANFIYLRFATHKIQKLYDEHPNDTRTRNIKIVLAGRTNLYFPIAISLLPIIKIIFLLAYFVIHTYTGANSEFPLLSHCFNYFRYLLKQDFI